MSFAIYNAHPNIWVHADGVTHNLSLVTNITFSYTDAAGILHTLQIPSSQFLIHTTTKILFLVPDACDFTLSLITVTINGTVFSGTVGLGPNSVIIANGSGIYRLIANQTHDTLYVDVTLGNVTADIKIPDPSFKTGFISG